MERYALLLLVVLLVVGTATAQEGVVSGEYLVTIYDVHLGGSCPPGIDQQLTTHNAPLTATATGGGLNTTSPTLGPLNFRAGGSGLYTADVNDLGLSAVITTASDGRVGGRMSGMVIGCEVNAAFSWLLQSALIDLPQTVDDALLAAVQNSNLDYEEIRLFNFAICGEVGVFTFPNGRHLTTPARDDWGFMDNSDLLAYVVPQPEADSPPAVEIATPLDSWSFCEGVSHWAAVDTSGLGPRTNRDLPQVEDLQITAVVGISCPQLDTETLQRFPQCHDPFNVLGVAQVPGLVTLGPDGGRLKLPPLGELEIKPGEDGLLHLCGGAGDDYIQPVFIEGESLLLRVECSDDVMLSRVSVSLLVGESGTDPLPGFLDVDLSLGGGE